MSDSPRFGFEDDMNYRADKPSRGWGRTCLMGCLWTSAVLVVVITLLGIWAAPRLRGWFASIGSQAIKQSIQAANLPQQEKDELGVEIDRVAEAFREGKLSGDQVGAILTMIMKSPLAGAIAVAVADAQYFDASGLSEEEKTAGRLTLQRFTLGAIDERIPEAKRDEVLALIGEKDAKGNFQLRERVSDEELRAFLAKAQAEADAAGIEPQPPAVDLSSELKRIVDQALADPNSLPAEMPDGAVDAAPQVGDEAQPDLAIQPEASPEARPGAQ
jgi:hypothetical protein